MLIFIRNIHKSPKIIIYFFFHKKQLSKSISTKEYQTFKPFQKYTFLQYKKKSFRRSEYFIPLPAKTPFPSSFSLFLLLQNPRLLQHLGHLLHRDDFQSVPNLLGTSDRSRTFSFGINTFFTPDLTAAISFSGRPPMGISRPFKDTSPVIAHFGFTI